MNKYIGLIFWPFFMAAVWMMLEGKSAILDYSDIARHGVIGGTIGLIIGVISYRIASDKETRKTNSNQVE